MSIKIIRMEPKEVELPIERLTIGLGDSYCSPYIYPNLGTLEETRNALSDSIIAPAPIYLELGNSSTGISIEEAKAIIMTLQSMVDYLES